MELSSLFLAGKGSALTSFFSTAFLVVFLPFCLVPAQERIRDFIGNINL